MTLLEHLFWRRHSFNKSLKSIISFTPHGNPLRSAVLLSPFYLFKTFNWKIVNIYILDSDLEMRNSSIFFLFSNTYKKFCIHIAWPVVKHEWVRFSNPLWNAHHGRGATMYTLQGYPNSPDYTPYATHFHPSNLFYN